MRLLGRLFISPWLLCPFLGLLLLGASLIDHPTLLKLEYLIYDQLLEFRTVSSNDRVVLIATDQYGHSGQANNPDSHSSLTTLLDKVRLLGGDTIALLTPLSFTEQTSPSDLTLKHSLKINDVIVAAPSTQQEIPFSENFSAASLLPPAKPLPDPQQLLLSGQNPLAQYRLNRPETWEFPPKTRNIDQTLPTGHLIFSPDPDGKIRSQMLLMPWKNQLIPSLPLRLAMLAQDENLQKLQTIPRELTGTLQTRTLQIPVIGYHRMLFDIHPEHFSFQSYRAVDLLQDKLKQDALQNKVILIGPTNSYGDRHLVAGYGSMSTSEMAALTTATLLANSAPQRPVWGWLLEAAALLYFTALLILLIPRLSARAGLAILLLFLISWALIAAGSLIIFGIWLKVVPTIILCLAGFTLARWHIGRQERYRHKQENYRVLAQRFQEQGLLDLALEKALLIEPNIKSNKATLYNLGLEFERKRMPHNAVSVYRHLLQAGRFRDTKTRLKQLAKHDQTTILSQDNNATVMLNRSGEKPTLGRYRIERELGQGAMGTVYLGNDPKINRQVAIKTLAYQQVDRAELPQVKERFFREAEAAGNLSHPNIVTIYDVGEETDLAFFAMEFLEGKDLSSFCRPKKRLAVLQVIKIILQTASALDYAHRQGVIHRDIKPANIVFLPEGQIKVTDFGIARIMTSSRTETGIILGTPSYMSPEQVAGKKVDGRSDLFSLGVVMYELLSGEKPFQGESMAALMYNIANASYRPLAEICPKLPSPCYTIVDKLLQKTLTRRFKSAAILRQELLTLQKMVEKQ
ncbi:MAG: serine/threonine-protein kinase [Desulfuromusa sp.]|nr:serine/threonine-protein kinase [Desulfuromusa sp.]